ncbi:MAG: NTP transferase domain-containing protein [Pseudomonadota bacterium]
MSIEKTIVINAAGMGSRLGLGTTKCLLEVRGKTILEWHLEALKEFEDVRVVVGFRAEEVIARAVRTRNDLIFVFNHDYRNTGTLASLAGGTRFGGDFVVSVDGDLLLRPRDLLDFCRRTGPVLGICPPCTDEPVYARVKEEGGTLQVESFTRESGDWEWTGLLQVPAAWIKVGPKHVYQVVLEYLPLPAVIIETREIDTYADYRRALDWADEIDLRCTYLPVPGASGLGQDNESVQQ